MRWYLAWPDTFWRFKYVWESRWLKWVKTKECPSLKVPKTCQLPTSSFFNILHFFGPLCSCFSWLFLMLPVWPITHSVRLSQRSLRFSLLTEGATGKKPAFMHEEGIGDPTVWLCEKCSQTQRRQQANQNKTLATVADTKQICRKTNH